MWIGLKRIKLGTLLTDAVWLDGSPTDYIHPQRDLDKTEDPPDCYVIDADGKTTREPCESQLPAICKTSQLSLSYFEFKILLIHLKTMKQNVILKTLMSGLNHGSTDQQPGILTITPKSQL